ncbi:MAG: 4Fe-4S binding protein [Spirochaetes bacterium]|nr:4Fe-4S binding protein [Spirochaetota bacterium]
MADVYNELRSFLDSIPNGFPATENGTEIKILKKIFNEEEAALFMKLKLAFETPEQIASRTGLELEYVKKMLPVMKNKGQLLGISKGEFSLYRIFPFVFGIYEFQGPLLDKELAELSEEYMNTTMAEEFFSKDPPMMKSIPIGIEVKDDSTIEPYESVAALIEGSKAWSVRDCICKKEKALIGKACDRPMEVCLSFAPVPGVFDNDNTCRAITKDEAYAILKMSEELGLVHMTSNYKGGHFYICNCCKCCCGPLTKYIAVSKKAVAKSNYIAVVDENLCISCEACLDRCQANAIEVKDKAEITDCIGCGLCVSTCPVDAISLKRREKDDIPEVPANEREWLKIRAAERGMNDDYKKLL